MKHLGREMSDHLQQLREKMSNAGVDFYYVPAADAHRNEYVPACWQRRTWISNFTGSAGDALIGLEQAYLWTDGRYFLQAEQELDSQYFQLMKQQQNTPPIHEWLKTHAAGKTCAVDAKLITMTKAEKWQNTLNENGGELQLINTNWIDNIWQDQPSIPNQPIEILDLKYTGQTTQDKIIHLRSALKSQQADAQVITRLDAIAWLFNLRGKDIDYNPLAISYAIVTQDTAMLFIDPKKTTTAHCDYFEKNNISLHTYENFQSSLNTLKDTVLLDPASTSSWTAAQLTNAKIIQAQSPITLMKAIKNKTELAGMREAHRLDAIAVIRFLHWLEKNWQTGVTELSAADKLAEFRRSEPRCVDLSFPTISGFASNGAIIHYAANEASNKTINDTALYLLDSGGQYREGTTDITRTVHLGEPTDEEKRHYTLVLKGHIQLRHAIFPKGTTGEALDPIARGPIQAAGYDYGHGTGHGVGCYLCVHEGPQAISPSKTGVALEAGMIVSNEPGLYFENRYGIRVENLCEITATNSGHLTLADLTLVPHARKLIDIRMLNDEEIKWINTYHQQIYHALRENLPDDVRDWLEISTASL